MEHRSSPDERLVSRIQEADRNHLEAVRVDRRNMVLTHHLWLLVGAEHERNVRSVNVSIEQSDFMTHLRECERQVDCERSLADAAFAGTDGDDGVDARQRLGSWWLLSGMGMSAHGSIIRDLRGRVAALMWAVGD